MRLNFTKLSFLLLSALMMPLCSFAQDKVTATFDDLVLEKDSFWNGADLKGGFVSGSYKFKTDYNTQYNSWSGFAYSNVTTTDFISYADKSAYGNVTGKGCNGSENYAVVYCSGVPTIDMAQDGDSAVINGFYVTNSNYTYASMSKGDSFAHKFAKGDWLMLTVTDTLTKKKVDYYLADFRSENEADHYIIDSWQWVDLTSLGSVKSLQFSLSGSDTGQNGLNTPLYFCMDDFGGQYKVEEVFMRNVKSEGPATLDLSSIITFEDKNATVTYALEGLNKEVKDTKFEVKGDKLIISGANAFVKVTVKAVQKGQVRYVAIPVMYSNSITTDATATFEELALDKESYWNGADCSGVFYSGSFKFKNYYTPEYSSWEAFSYANLTSNVFESYSDSTHYTNAVGGGYDGSANYAIVNASGWSGPTEIEVINTEEGASLRGFYITNAACASKAVSEGLAPARKFEKGDWLKLTITETATKKSLEYYLADYRSENEADHYALDTWQWVDLRELGNVKALQFSVSGSDESKWGLNTPAYFCMDNFNGHREIKEVAAQTMPSGTSIDLAQFFTFDNNDASVVYSVDDAPADSSYQLTINGSKLEVKGTVLGDISLVVKAVKKGKVYFVRIPVTVTDAIEGVEADGSFVTERYTIDGKRVNAAVKGVNIIRTDNGNVKKVVVR